MKFLLFPQSYTGSNLLGWWGVVWYVFKSPSPHLGAMVRGVFFQENIYLLFYYMNWILITLYCLAHRSGFNLGDITKFMGGRCVTRCEEENLRLVPRERR